jgi:hypothetical protein
LARVQVRGELSRPSISNISPAIATRAGSAIAAIGDYTPLSRRVTFLSRDASGTIDLKKLRAIVTPGAPEVFFLDLTNADGAPIAAGVGTGPILSPFA